MLDSKKLLDGLCAKVGQFKDEEYVRLYEAEKRRYLNAGTSKRARQKFGEWKENSCYGHPSQEEMEDYRMEKVLHMFEKGVFKECVEHIQRATHYPGELNFEQLESNMITKTIYHHYAALRKMVDWKDGELVVNPARVGRHFYACRHEPNAKSNRTNFLKYMHKIYLAQEEMERVEVSAMEVEEERENVPDKLKTPEAENLMEALVDAGVLNEDWQPNGLSGTERALVAKAVSERIDLNEVWQVFGQLWNEKPETLRSYLNKALEQKKSLKFQEKLNHVLR